MCFHTFSEMYHLFLQLYSVFNGELIIVDFMVSYMPTYQIVYTSPSGLEGMTRFPVEEVEPEMLTNGMPKISLLTANFLKMQQRKATFGFTGHWERISIDEMVAVAMHESPPKNITIEPPSTLAAFTINDLQGAFYILMVMLAICFAAFLCELRFGRP